MVHLVLLLAFLINPHKTGPEVKDSFYINTPNYQGYIMPPHSCPYEKYDTGSAYFLPSRNEVFNAEDYLKIYLDSICSNVGHYETSNFKKIQEADDSIVPAKYDCTLYHYEFPKYFRQYVSY